jgi:hypothetical protein
MRNPHFGNRRSGHSAKRPLRKLKKPMLIICEGRETERNYFTGLKQEDWARKYFQITVKRGKGGSREQIAQFAVDQKNHSSEDFDAIFCVMDVEEPNQNDPLEKALRILSEHSITSCLSNPSFEVWLLSHFEKTGKIYYHCDAVIADINKHWKKHFNDHEYQKADESIYERLKKFLETAVENARWVREVHHEDVENTLEANSSTEVYRLVELIRIGPKKR